MRNSLNPVTANQNSHQKIAPDGLSGAAFFFLYENALKNAVYRSVCHHKGRAAFYAALITKGQEKFVLPYPAYFLL